MVIPFFGKSNLICLEFMGNINLVATDDHRTLPTSNSQVTVKVGNIFVGDRGGDIKHNDSTLTAIVNKQGQKERKENERILERQELTQRDVASKLTSCPVVLWTVNLMGPPLV